MQTPSLQWASPKRAEPECAIPTCSCPPQWLTQTAPVGDAGQYLCGYHMICLMDANPDLARMYTRMDQGLSEGKIESTALAHER